MAFENKTQVKEIWQKDSKHLCIHWGDGATHVFATKMLRKNCRCALCVDEITGNRKPVDLKEDAAIPTMIKSVGRYALSIQFRDGHNTGIYSFSFLRSLGEG